MNAIRSRRRKSSYPPCLLSDAAAICSMVESSGKQVDRHLIKDAFIQMTEVIARDTDLSDISHDPVVTSDSSQSSILDDTDHSIDSIVRCISRLRHEDNPNQDRVNDTLGEMLDDSTLPLHLFRTQNSRGQEVFEQSKSMCSICNVNVAAYSLSPCQHTICNLCYQINFRPSTEASSSKVTNRSPCYICFQVNFNSLHFMLPLTDIFHTK